jgi:alpha-D-xyloside xylohydrolase
MTNIRTTRINSWQATPGSVLITTHRITDGEPVAGLLEISAVQNHILRVRFTERSAFRNPESLMVMAGEAAGALRVEDGPDALLLATADVQLEIDKNSTAFSWRDANGNPLVREPANPGRRLHEIPVFRTVWDDQAEVATEKTVDGEKVRAAGGKTVQDRLAYSAKVSFEFADGEAIYGLGQHEEGVLNYRGHYQYLYQQNMKVAMPAFVSSRGYGCLFDTTALSIFRDDQQGTYFWTEVVEELDFYFLYGPEFDRIVGGIRDLTGHLPMLPKWAYGYCQSKERYVTQDELLAIAAEYRRRRLPLDCIVQDWCTWPDGQWGYKTFDPSRFPDPGKLMEELHAVNVRLMVSIWPNLTGEQNRDLAEFREAGELLGNQATYNAFLPAARERYWRQANHGYFQHGIDAWWCDCTEPFEADWNGEVKLEPEQRLAANTGESRKYLDPSRINAYSLLHARGIYEGQRRQTDRKRVANLTRSACPGQQRYATVTWSGDVEATWSRLRRQIADGLNFAVTGNPRWTFDIGAFFVKPGKEWFRAGEYPEGCDDLGYRELYTRWFQLGAFLPMFRSHGTDTPREIWRFGEPGTRFYDTLRAFSELRYRLLPYVYSVAARECFDA